uniref:GST C-terminal domain-containing protein n=1 Tax=Oryza nivara TaxID=4536 RepID=A0A0E0IXL7_ORYNI
MEQLLVLEKVLHENKFFGGERIGFVDLSLGSLSYVIPIYEDITGVRLITSDKFPWLSAWMEGFLGLPLGAAQGCMLGGIEMRPPYEGYYCC